jgi:hypothetical protein
MFPNASAAFWKEACIVKDLEHHFPLGDLRRDRFLYNLGGDENAKGYAR